MPQSLRSTAPTPCGGTNLSPLEPQPPCQSIFQPTSPFQSPKLAQPMGSPHLHRPFPYQSPPTHSPQSIPKPWGIRFAAMPVECPLFPPPPVLSGGDGGGVFRVYRGKPNYPRFGDETRVVRFFNAARSVHRRRRTLTHRIPSGPLG